MNKKALTKVELNKDQIIKNVLSADENTVDDDRLRCTIDLSEQQLNTLIVSLGLLPMEDIVKDAEEDYDLTKDDLAPNHEVYDYLMENAKATNLKGDKKV